VHARTPRPIVQKLNADFVRATRSTSEKLIQAGAEPVGSTSQEFAVFLGNEIKKWGKVVRDAGIKPD
jgi:tripartite-type tricarboxylate transporter receptor subunit TctC